MKKYYSMYTGYFVDSIYLSIAIAQRSCDPICVSVGIHVRNTDHIDEEFFCIRGDFVRDGNDNIAMSLITVELEHKFSATSSMYMV